MDEILFRALAERVGGYLDGVDRLAAAQSREAGRELRRLTGAWRALLGQHVPVGRRRRCLGCHAPRGSPGMCPVWRVAGIWFSWREPGGTVRA
ncbi:MAG: hypothetical protein ABW215_05520 [Kibdelosporangium sp.]